MKSSGIDAVRVPLNEACWNGESYVDRAYSGVNYQAAIEAYVKLLNSNGIVVILDLHWTDGKYTGQTRHGCVSAKAVCAGADAGCRPESVPFWSSVAASVQRTTTQVIFDLFNEPFPDRALPTEAAAWECWLKGASSCLPRISYQVAGMQTLVNAVRAAGANNVIMLGGLAFSNDLTEWLKYEPTDPDHNLVASWHSYNFNRCSTPSCWTSQIAPVIASVPVVAGEIGEAGCADSYIDPLMAYLDYESTGYLAWAWNASFNCSGGPGLITSYPGTPTAYGAGFEHHLQSLASGPRLRLDSLQSHWAPRDVFRLAGLRMARLRCSACRPCGLPGARSVEAGQAAAGGDAQRRRWLRAARHRHLRDRPGSDACT